MSQDSPQLMLKSRTSCTDLHSRIPRVMMSSLGRHWTSPMLSGLLPHVCFPSPFTGFSREHFKKKKKQLSCSGSASGEKNLQHLPGKLSSLSPQMAPLTCNFLMPKDMSRRLPTSPVRPGRGLGGFDGILFARCLARGWRLQKELRLS